MSTSHRVVYYDTKQYPFAEMVGDILNVRRLEELHDVAVVPAELVKPGTDQATAVHARFYAGMGRILPLYRTFVREEVAPRVPGQGPVIYQIKPTFRWHPPGNLGVGAFHRDNDYRHQPQELNFWVPLTRAMRTSTIWIESEPGKEDYSPVELEYGQMLIFSGSKLSHGNKPNQTAHSRVSFDLRALRRSNYSSDWQGTSHNTGLRFTIGSYYAELLADPPAGVAA